MWPASSRRCTYKSMPATCNTNRICYSIRLEALRDLDDTPPKTFEKLDEELLKRIMSLGTVKEVGSMGRRYARLTREQRKKGLRDNPELIKKTEKATKKMRKTVARLRKKGFDMAVPTRGDGREHTRVWLEAIEAADAM